MEDPKKERIGSGLCYNSDLTSKQEAEDFVQHWGEDRLRTGQFNHPLNQNTMQTTGGLNCFSVGLASGFIESEPNRTCFVNKRYIRIKMF